MGGNLTLPNLLSMLRIAAAPFLIIAMTQRRFDVALALFVAAGITDFADGWIARRWGWTSALGALLDPAGDKLILNSIYVALAVPALPARVHLPAFLAVIVLSRDVLIVTIALIFFLGQGKRSFPPSAPGRIATFVLIVDAAAILLANVVVPPEWVVALIVWSATAVTVVSGFHYIWLAARFSGTERTDG